MQDGTNKIIHKASDNLYSRLSALDIDKLEISEYSKDYLIRYISNFPYYSSMYIQLLQKAAGKLKRSVAESAIIDYGGGCGILSFLAKETGFKTVIYNDLNNESVRDAITISNALGISIDHFISGDIGILTGELENLSAQPDLICSFDVLEHIYNLRSWFKSFS